MFNMTFYQRLTVYLPTRSLQTLSKEEEEKRRIRRERNKIAATKCRQKRRAHSTNVGSEYNQVSFLFFDVFYSVWLPDF